MEFRKEMKKKDREPVKAKSTLLPKRLKGLEEDDSLKIIEVEKLLKLGVLETDPILCFSGNQFLASSYTIEAINEKNDFIAQIECSEGLKKSLEEKGFKGEIKIGDLINIKLDYVEFTSPKVEKEDLPTFTLKIVSDKDDEIKKEMIALIDRDRLQKIFSVPTSLRKPYTVTDNIIDMYLEKWAEAKLPYYKMFGNKLAIAEKISYSMEPNEMSVLLNELIIKYPKYALNIAAISPEHYISNSMPRVDAFARYFGKTYSQGMKISKFFTSFDDTEFDNDLSKVMQERVVNGELVISIDPYDYLTHAISMHGWGSCHSLTSNCAPVASFMYMIDNTTLVAYKHNGKDYVYDKGYYRDGESNSQFDFKKNAFVGNSKSFRQLIHMDLNSSAMLFSREYPKRTTSDEMRIKVRELLEGQVSSYLGIENKFDNYGSNLNHYKCNNENNHYSDIKNYDSLRRSFGDTVKMDFVTIQNCDMSNVKVSDGSEAFCLKCGSKLSNRQVFCGNCN